ncbi:hypothetical protein D3981_003925 [Escherichia coli]|nr:hypothetical protein [Escherichia coli]
MAKYISTHELSEIIVGLLLKPELLGELDTPEKHRALMVDLGRVVTEHCGGHIYGVTLPVSDETVAENGFAGDEPVQHVEVKENTPYLVVEPDDCLPSLSQNVWMFADADGWAEHVDEQESLPTQEQCQQIRQQLQRLLNPTPKGLAIPSEINITMQDWRREEETLPPEDSQVFRVLATIGKDVNLEVQDTSGEPCFGFMFEINQGVPALHINDGQNATLHIHSAHSGLVMTPDSPELRFDAAPVDRYSYNSPGLLLPHI